MVDRNINTNEDGSLDRVWREFGKQTEAGKLLYDLYGVRYRPDKFVNYPKLKTKPKSTITEERPKSVNKMAKAINKISYPEQTSINNFQYHKVDFIPKRKKENVIRQELEVIKDQMSKHNNKPTINRKMQIESLQDKFMFQERTVMPKGARLPGIRNNNNSSPEEEDQVVNNKPTNKAEELRYLYSQIIKEIDERYIYMDEMKKLGKNMDLIIMDEIKDRLEELKKLKSMME